MNLIIEETYEDMSRRAADVIAEAAGEEAELRPASALMGHRRPSAFTLTLSDLI